MFCVTVCTEHMCAFVSAEARRVLDSLNWVREGCEMPCGWVLGTEPRSSGGAASASLRHLSGPWQSMGMPVTGQTLLSAVATQ